MPTVAEARKFWREDPTPPYRDGCNCHQCQRDRQYGTRQYCTRCCSYVQGENCFCTNQFAQCCADPYDTEYDEDKDIYLGVELELENKYGTWSERDVPTVRALNIRLKGDGSLYDGTELEFPPFSARWYYRNKDILTRLLNELKDHTEPKRTCGIHIHVNNLSFKSRFHKFKFVHFINNHKDTLVNLAGRHSSYAKYLPVREITKSIWLKYGTDKFCATNTGKRTTTEIRMFKSTLEPEDFFTFIEFLIALHNYTGQTPGTKVQEWENFVQFCQSKPRKYHYLNKFHVRGKLKDNQQQLHPEDDYMCCEGCGEESDYCCCCTECGYSDYYCVCDREY